MVGETSSSLALPQMLLTRSFSTGVIARDKQHRGSGGGLSISFETVDPMKELEDDYIAKVNKMRKEYREDLQASRQQVTYEREKYAKLEDDFDLLRHKNDVEKRKLNDKVQELETILLDQASDTKSLSSYQFMLKITLIKSYVRLWKNKKAISTLSNSTRDVMKTMHKQMQTLKKIAPRKSIDMMSPEVEAWLSEHKHMLDNKTSFTNVQRMIQLSDAMPIIADWLEVSSTHMKDIRSVCTSFEESNTKLMIDIMDYKKKCNETQMEQQSREFKKILSSSAHENEALSKQIIQLQNELQEQKKANIILKKQARSGLHFRVSKNRRNMNLTPTKTHTFPSVLYNNHHYNQSNTSLSPRHGKTPSPPKEKKKKNVYNNTTNGNVLGKEYLRGNPYASKLMSSTV